MRPGLLDRVPTWARDLVVGVLAALLGWAGADLVPILHDKGGYAALLAPVVVVLVNALTPLTKSYNAGGSTARDMAVRGVGKTS